jgi:hypothetical protein
VASISTINGLHLIMERPQRSGQEAA